MHLIRFLHVILSVTLSGLFVANYFYLSLCLKEKNSKLMLFTLKGSLFVDCIFLLPAILLLFATGSYQAVYLNFPLTTPWIISAYFFFSLITAIWLALFGLKSYNFILLNSKAECTFKGEVFVRVLYSMALLCLIFIIHDAVRKTTFIPWQYFIK